MNIIEKLFEINQKINLKITPEKNKKETKTLIFYKSLKIISKNWKYIITNELKNYIDKYFDIKFPILESEIIESITNSINYNILYNSFLKYIKVIFIKMILSIIYEIFYYFLLKDSLFNYKKIILDNISKKDIEFFDVFKTGEIIERINENENCLENNILYQILNFLFDFYYLSILLINLYKISYNLLIIYIFIYIIKYIINFISLKFNPVKNNESLMKNYDDYISKLTEFIKNFRLAKSFGVEKREVDKILKIKKKAIYPFNLREVILMQSQDALNVFGEVIVMYFSGKEILNKKLGFGKLIIFETYSLQIENYFKSFKDIYNKLNKLYINWKRFFEFYDYEPKIKSIKNIIPKIVKNYNLEFKNVYFSYPLKQDIKILKNISFKIKNGQNVAIVGYNGSGKTTIANLIQRFYEPQIGEIIFCDYNLKELDIDWLHKNIGYVSQDVLLMNDTIEANITYGVEKYKKKELIDICNLTNLSFLNDISLFPDGLKTIINENGKNLSGGQRQKISIARALIKNVKLLILDEPTSSLDIKSENEIIEIINSIIKNRKIITLIISHKISLIKFSDLILFLKNGKIIEYGKYDELINKKGNFFNLFQNQIMK